MKTFTQMLTDKFSQVIFNSYWFVFTEHKPSVSVNLPQQGPMGNTINFQTSTLNWKQRSVPDLFQIVVLQSEGCRGKMLQPTAAHVPLESKRFEQNYISATKIKA